MSEKSKTPEGPKPPTGSRESHLALVASGPELYVTERVQEMLDAIREAVSNYFCGTPEISKPLRISKNCYVINYSFKERRLISFWITICFKPDTSGTWRRTYTVMIPNEGGNNGGVVLGEGEYDDPKEITQIANRHTDVFAKAYADSLRGALRPEDHSLTLVGSDLIKNQVLVELLKSADFLGLVTLVFLDLHVEGLHEYHPSIRVSETSRPRQSEVMVEYFSKRRLASGRSDPEPSLILLISPCDGNICVSANTGDHYFEHLPHLELKKRMLRGSGT